MQLVGFQDGRAVLEKSGAVNMNPKKFRKKAISKACSCLDASRMTIAMQPNRIALDTMKKTARGTLPLGMDDSNIMEFTRQSGHL